MKNLVKKLVLKFKLKHFTIFVICCVALGIFTSQASLVDGQKNIIKFNQNPKNYNLKLQIFDSDKFIAEFMIAKAKSEELKIYGLMNLNELPQNFGMIFPFDQQQIINMWMKNTLIALDMIFIDENNEIISIKKNAEPKSLDIISSQKPAKMVLEVNGGISDKLGIKIGQKIIIN